MKKSIVLQHDQHDCGVSCLLTIIRHHGGDNALENLRRLSGTSVRGTTLLGLCQAAGKLGFDAAGYEATSIADLEGQSNSILHVVNEKGAQHYVVYFNAIQEGRVLKYVIGDPAKGIIHLTKEELERIWRSKHCLILTPNTAFKKVREISAAKRKWIKSLIKEDAPLLLLAMALGLGIAVLGLVMAIFSQRLIDNILPQKDLVRLNASIVLVFVLLTAREALSMLRQYSLLKQSNKFNIRITTSFFNHLLMLPKSFFDSRKIGELTARLRDTTRIQKVISQLAGNVIIDSLVAAVSLTFIITYTYKIGIACLLLMPLFYVIVHRNQKHIQAGQRDIMRRYAEAEANYISTLQGIEPIKSYNKQSAFSFSNKTIYKTYQDKILALGKIQIRLSFIVNIFSVLFLVGILSFASYEVLGGRLKLGELIAIFTMCGSLLPSVANLAMISIPVAEAKIAFDRMFEFTLMEPEPSTATPLAVPMLNSLKTDNVAFRFPGRRRLLKNISLDIRRGEIVAIMGENGCGKSTLLEILQKNYQPEEGKIIVNDKHCLQDISFNDWRRVMAVVPQHIHIFNGTVLENIAFDSAHTHPEKVTGFLRQFGFDRYINSLPQSFMTVVGEEGINLSGGQKQIIAFARALYHQPQLLIVDEGTSAMDRESEKFILTLLAGLKKEMAIVFTTHRLHILKSFCDRIYLLENGIMSTPGKHEELLQSANLYSQYWADLVS